MGEVKVFPAALIESEEREETVVNYAPEHGTLRRGVGVNWVRLVSRNARGSGVANARFGYAGQEEDRDGGGDDYADWDDSDVDVRLGRGGWII